MVASDRAAGAEDWRRQWYPLAFSQDLPPNEVRSVAVHDEPMALFRDGDGTACCVVDRCPHRAARLSDGQVIEGRLECLYHGWQFAGDGRCAHIPQLRGVQPIPANASVTSFVVQECQGMIWLWPGPADTADAATLPTIAALDADDCQSIDFAIDLPYEQTFLIENVVDIAHIHVAHDGVRGGGHRHLALPLDFELSDRTPQGFTGTFRSVGEDEDAVHSDLRGAQMEFRAPNLVHYESLYEDADLVSGLALYSVPLGRRRCRLLYRAYSNFWPVRTRLRPRWLEHWTQCTILEQDMDVVVGQAAQIERLDQPPKDLWLPLKSSDAFVLAYRRWLDEFAGSWPFAVGFRHLHGAGSDSTEPPIFNRYEMHTKLCTSCRRAEALCQALKMPMNLSMVALLAAAAVTAGTAASPTAAVMAVGLAIGRGLIDRVLRQFH